MHFFIIKGSNLSSKSVFVNQIINFTCEQVYLYYFYNNEIQFKMEW